MVSNLEFVREAIRNTLSNGCKRIRKASGRKQVTLKFRILAKSKGLEKYGRISKSWYATRRIRVRSVVMRICRGPKVGGDMEEMDFGIEHPRE